MLAPSNHTTTLSLMLPRSRKNTEPSVVRTSVQVATDAVLGPPTRAEAAFAVLHACVERAGKAQQLARKILLLARECWFERGNVQRLDAFECGNLVPQRRAACLARQPSRMDARREREDTALVVVTGIAVGMVTSLVCVCCFLTIVADADADSNTP